jgi:hypothetical protein
MMSQIDFENWYWLVVILLMAVAVVDKLFGMGLFGWEEFD